MNPFTAIIGILKHCGWTQGLDSPKKYPTLCLGSAIAVLFDAHNVPFNKRPRDRRMYDFVTIEVATAINPNFDGTVDDAIDTIVAWNDTPGRTEEEVLALLQGLQSEA